MTTATLDAATFDRLSETVDTIVHSGASVNMVLPYSALRAANVLGVESVLRLATTGRLKTVHHISTVEVLSDTVTHRGIDIDHVHGKGGVLDSAVVTVAWVRAVAAAVCTAG